MAAQEAGALADARGRLFAILLTGGEAHDCPVAERLIATGKASKRLIGDKAYDSAELRLWLKDRGTKPVIPNRSNRKQPFRFKRRLYKERRRIENAFGRLKDFRRIATRYDRLACHFLAFEWNGRRYRSLTIVAREITGAHWSGPRFFGLRKCAGRSAESAEGEHAEA